MVKLIGRSEDEVNHGTFEEFVLWESSLFEYQLDVETNVVNELPKRKLITIQFGDIWGRDQWVLQVSQLKPSEARKVKEILENKRKVKLIHNASFEYTVFLLYGIIIENVYDTMLAEMVLHTGIDTPEGFYSLAGLTKRYLFKEVSKAEQTTFGDDILTKAKVEYAAEDVKNLGKIRIQQIDRIKHERLETVLSLENEVTLAFGDITFNGMKLDQEMWKENIAIAEPIIEEANNELERIVRDSLMPYCIAEGLIYEEDKININWNSAQQRKIIFNLYAPDLEITTQLEIKRYLKNNYNEVLEAYINKDYEYIEELVISEHRDVLIQNDLLIPANKLLINWNSTQQRLALFQQLVPELQNTNKESLSKYEHRHPIFRIYQNYINSTKLITSYGETFLDLLDSDGKIRPSFKQILSTGRVSCNKKMQTIPAKESVGNAYRNCFMADEGHVFVDSDYSSQELCYIAEMSNDPVWIDALNKGQDLHSICAELVFGDKWKEAAEEDCVYYQSKDKCKCKKHKSMRTAVKTINFGLA